jgi:hypothetical protein
MTTALRPLTFGELLDRTFVLYRQHFVVFVGIVALPQLVLLALQLLNVALGLTGGFNLAWLVSLLGVLLVSLVAGTVSQAATVVAVSQLHLERPVSIAQAYDAIKGRVLELCLIMIVIGFLIGLGFLAFIVPGVLLALRWSLAVPATVLEHLGLRETMSRSAKLTEGQRGRVFVIYCLFFVLSVVFSAVWQIPVFIAAVAASRADQAPPAWAEIAGAVGGFLSTSLVGPLMMIALSLVYYDQRVRKEAFDIEHMLAQLDRVPDESVDTAPAG